ncbi:MAG TPA: hypothetical protein VJB36_04025, partial [Methylomirabilota bacterium]|nr:hypothetical protein [Methylomirabilota bacterium]
MPEMVRLEKELIQSPAWGWASTRIVLPWAVRGLGREMAGRLLEIGAGTGANAERLLEHVRPRNRLLGAVADALSPITRRVFGFNLNRRTEENAVAAGLHLLEV